jgi:hypothetical protein
VAEQRTPGWVHVGRFDVFVDESGRLATKPAPTEETVQAEGLATVIRDLRREPQKAVAALDQSVKSVKAATGMVERLVELARDLANLSDPAIAAKRAEKFVARILDDYREGRFRDVVLLVGALLNIYLLAERWRALVALLQLDRLSAEELGDSAEALAAQHDLDVLAEACGLSPPAGESPDEAHDVAEPAGDLSADATGQAASATVQPAVQTGVALGVKVAAAVVGTVVLAAAATGFAVGDGVWFDLGREDAEGLRAGGDAEILAFAAGDSTDVPGFQSEQAGFEPPEGRIEPGETLAVCEPPYVYDYTRFQNMVDGADYSSTMTPSSAPGVTRTGTWSGPAEYTEGVWTRPASPPFPYGEWVLVVEIGGVEVDRAEFTVEENCAPD